MEMLMCGRLSLICLTISHLLLWLSQKYSVFMVVCHHLLKHLIIFVVLIVYKKFHMKGQCVIFYGLILMIVVVGVYHLGVLDIPLAKTYQSNLTILTT
nr:serine/threonine-protein phosphatase PP2A catalytic subunit isoform X3 [Ipomoea batatas]GME01091.1 serine/threonine-protein phosphatase PP2A catalytic subunit isoform X3 [Ipomoea batatas]GME04375.1 serine/threonine-protein phosphatase PP2A catalytic subunit isoform X3 [Ipomoea batatas]